MKSGRPLIGVGDGQQVRLAEQSACEGEAGRRFDAAAFAQSVGKDDRRMARQVGEREVVAPAT